VREYGEPDAYGHRKKASVAESLADEIKRRTGALVKGCYELVPIPDPKLGPRKLDVATMYNTERYRPMYANKRALPVFLQRAS
jgi:6-phosphofructokinase 1